MKELAINRNTLSEETRKQGVVIGGAHGRKPRQRNAKTQNERKKKQWKHYSSI